MRCPSNVQSDAADGRIDRRTDRWTVTDDTDIDNIARSVDEFESQNTSFCLDKSSRMNHSAGKYTTEDKGREEGAKDEGRKLCKLKDRKRKEKREKKRRNEKRRNKLNQKRLEIEFI